MPLKLELLKEQLRVSMIALGPDHHFVLELKSQIASAEARLRRKKQINEDVYALIAETERKVAAATKGHPRHRH